MIDNWDFYAAQVDHSPASIMVNLDIISEAPKSSHPTLVYIRVYLRFPNENGLSTNEEFDDLCRIDDSITEKSEASDAHIYVGRNTSSGQRDFYFYTQNADNLKAILTQTMSNFPDYEFDTGSRDDERWDAYTDFLYPKPDELQRIMNRRVCRQLHEQGDDLNQVRQIDHRVYFKKKSRVKAFEKAVVTQNYIVAELGRTKPLVGKFYLDFYRENAPSKIDETVLPLLDLAAKNDGEYDGWGCPIVTA